jgi:hypothetical protein
LKTLFQDVDLIAFQPEAYPDFSFFRVLEYDDVEEVAWLRRSMATIRDHAPHT